MGAGMDGMMGEDAFPPALRRYGRTLPLASAGAVPLPELLEPARLTELLRVYGDALASADGRAVVSMWSQHYLLALVPPVVAAALVAARLPRAELPSAAGVVGPEGCLVGMCLPDEPAGCGTACPAGRLCGLLRGHLGPAAEALAPCGLSPRLFWSNARAVVDWTLGVVGAPDDRLDALRGAVAAPVWVDGGANPLAAVPGRTGRSLCCLRFRLPGMARCPDCPAGGAGLCGRA